MSKIKIGITIGDLNGIGPEVVLKALSNKKIFKFCTPIIYASTKAVSYHKNIVSLEDLPLHGISNAEHADPEKINVVNVWNEVMNITIGKATDIGGKYAFRSLERATEDLQKGLIDGIITAPINKKAMNMSGFPFPGHTEYLTQKLSEGEESVMLMVQDGLRVGLVTNHLPISKVAAQITHALVLKKIQIMHETLMIDFGLDRPLIAVLGLNPHAGDEGVLGHEEEMIIRPAVLEAKEQGIMVMGPFPADGFFGAGQYQKYDGILAMYHDQGLIPFKTLAFGGGVNYTAGLPFIRTSPDHGTAYDIAGKNVADHASFLQALFLGIDIVKSRRNFAEMHANPLVRSSKPLEEVEGS